MEARKKKQLFAEMDLTSGNLFWKIPLLALPMAVTTILQLLYTTVDLYTVSHFGGGSNSMSAIGSNTPLINLIINTFVGLSLGANVAIGNARGRNDRLFAKKVLSSSLLLALITGLLVGISGFFLSPYLLKMMQTPEVILSASASYLKIYFLGLPFLMIYNYAAQMLRGLGDSRTPLLALILSGIINIILDSLFVIVGKMDVEGVALATVVSEIISSLFLVLWFIFHRSGFVFLDLKELKPDRKAMAEVLRIGIPSGIEHLAFDIPNVLIQSSLYTITDYVLEGENISVAEIVAGSSSSAQLEGYVFSIMDAFAGACVSFVGQNFGAKKEGNIRKVYWYCQFWMLFFWLLDTLLSFFFPFQLLGIFLTAGDGIDVGHALLAGKERLYIMILTYALDGIMCINGQYLRGMKHSGVPALLTLFGVTGSRILFLLVFFPKASFGGFFHTVTWLYSCYPISWIIIDILYIPVIKVVEKKELSSFSLLKN